MANIKNMRDENGKCLSYGFYQRNYFCDVCDCLEPKTYAECLKETQKGIKSGRITKEQIEEMNK